MMHEKALESSCKEDGSFKGFWLTPQKNHVGSEVQGHGEKMMGLMNDAYF